MFVIKKNYDELDKNTIKVLREHLEETIKVTSSNLKNPFSHFMTITLNTKILEYNTSDDCFYILYNDDNDICGSAIVDLYFIKSEKSIHLSKIYINPLYRGNGVGGFFISEIKGDIKKIYGNDVKYMTLGVDSYNKRAIKFYRNIGFSDTYIDMVSEI